MSRSRPSREQIWKRSLQGKRRRRVGSGCAGSRITVGGGKVAEVQSDRVPAEDPLGVSEAPGGPLRNGPYRLQPVARHAPRWHAASEDCYTMSVPVRLLDLTPGEEPCLLGR